MTKSALATRFLTKWGFTLAITGFAVLVAMASYVVFEYRNFARLEIHTNEVISQLRQLEASIERAETSQRGYLISRQLSFLQPYHKAVYLVSQELTDLTQLVADNPLQVWRAKNLDRLIDERIQKMETIIDEASRLPMSQVAKHIDTETMNELRTEIGKMETEELNLLAERRKYSQRFSALSIVFLIFGGLSAFLLLIFSARLIRTAAKRNMEQSSLISQVFDSMTDGLIVINKDLVVTHSNRASDLITEKKLRGMTLAEVYSHSRPATAGDAPADIDYRNSSLYRALRGETVLRFEVTMGNVDRKLISVDARAVVGEDGEIVAAFCTYQDITQRRATEDEWRNAREAALQASRLKSDFLATMSHEIRTPMNGVMGMATLLLATDMTNEQESYVKTIKGSADSLLSLINQVLDHSKIEAGKLELDKQDFDLSGVIEGVMSLFRYLARSKNIDLKIVSDPAVPPALHGDPNRLRQILLNLVGNALKFTERGYVEVLIKPVDDTGHKLEFSVRDSGPGIPPDKQSHLFQKFSQVHDSKFVKAAGSGLGLMISRELVRVMGGEMGVESAVGVGSRFWFTAVFEVAKMASLCEWKPKGGREPLNGRILVAEDQVVNQLVIQKFLTSFGLECVIAEEGGAAVERAQSEHFDLIFMDCRMIPMDGYEATRRIRAFNKIIPIVALTAEGVSGEKRLCLEAGMNEVVNKPVDIDQIYRLLQGYLNKPDYDESQLDKLAEYESEGKSLIETLSEDFFTNGKALVVSLEESVRAGDLEKMKHYAHALRSPGLTLGLAAFAKLCAELEETGPGYDQIELRSKLDRLNSLYNRACGWLRQQTRSSKVS